MPWLNRATVTTICLLAATACGPRGTSPTGGDAPRLLGACCPNTDAAIYALMRQYESTAAAARPPELAILPYRISSGLVDRRQIAIRDSESWAATWDRIVGRSRPTPPLPAVDFSKEMLVVASMGSRPTGGYTVMIEEVTVAGSTLVVFVREQSPGRTCGVTDAVSAPVALARLVRSELPVRFVTRSVVRDC